LFDDKHLSTAISRGYGPVVAAVTVPEYALRLPAASVARIRYMYVVPEDSAGKAQTRECIHVGHENVAIRRNGDSVRSGE